MLEHLAPEGSFAPRTVVLGAAGFVGGAIAERLRAQGATVLGLGRAELDLQSPGAGERLAARLRADDALVCASARAPVKNLEMLRDNVAILETIGTALSVQPVAHLLNIGSDAVYADRDDALDEASCASPGSLHGIMHWTREVVLGEAAGDTPLATLRPTLIYGARDPHDGYGPNRFRRLASEGKKIVLFGEGEERRDHVWVEDVAALAVRMLARRSRGVLNAATGSVISFKRAAELVVSHFERPVPIESSPRVGPMPHNGYRPFNPAATLKAFPDFHYTQPEDGFARVHSQVPARR